MKSKRKKKYLIDEYVQKLMPIVGSMPDFEALVKKYGISRGTFQRDRALVHTDTTSIPSDRLDIYAALFSVSSDDLKNYKVAVKPIQSKAQKHVESEAAAVVS